MRIPVVFGGAAGPGDAVLVEEGMAYAGAGYMVGFSAGLPGHVTGCACCGGRTRVAEVLGRMFLDRARGETPFFGRVVVVASPAGEAAVREAVEGDMVVRARYWVG